MAFSTTATLIENGSNANGEYWMFSDGTLVCTREETVTTSGIAFGDIVTYGFPKAFASGSVVTGGFSLGTGTGVSGAGTLSICQAYASAAYATDTTGWHIRSTDASYLFSSALLRMNAIGKWR